MDPLAQAAAKDTSGLVSVLDPTDRFCDRTTCHVVIGRLIAYFDHGHMTTAFARTLEPEVAEAVAALPGVSEVYSVTGALDLVAIVRVADHEQVAGVVADRLNKVPGILRTETHIAFRAYSAHDLEAAFSLGGD